MIDESGTPPQPGKTHPRYFVIAGVIIPEQTWTSVRDALLGLKIRHRIRGELKWRYFAPGNDDAQNPMRKLDQDTRDAIRSDIYRVIATKAHGITCLAAVCSAAAAYEIPSVNSQEDVYHLTYKVISERFQYFLQGEPWQNGVKPLGILVCDHRGAQDDKMLRAHHQMLIHSSAGYTSQYKNFIESLFLQPSHESIGIQLADLVAGAVWRKYERADTKFYDQIESVFRKSSGGIVLGYGIALVPKSNWR